MGWSNEQMAAARALIARHEGLALKPYRDSRGFLTIGRGRCLDTRGISLTEADYLFGNDLEGVLTDLAAQAWWEKLDPVRQVAIADMGFTLGAHGVLAFRRMIVALLAQKWGAAAEEMRNSQWAKEVGQRADDDAAIVLTGTLPK